MDTDLPVLSGLLACNKPMGVTSRDCVNVVVRLLRERYPKPARLPKVGHAGTLDPRATGVLVMGIGAGVRLVPYIQQMAKQYDATFRLGAWSESGDLEAEVHHEDSPVVPTLADLQAAAGQLIGSITQTPPSTSAIKVNGKKAYKYAHQGIAVVVPSRVVRVDSIAITRYDYPEVDALIQCGSGTYIRTLGMDLAIGCQTRAVMSRLQRTQIGAFGLTSCCTMDELTSESLPGALLPLSFGVAGLPRLSLTEGQMDKIAQGLKLDVADVGGLDFSDGSEAMLIDVEGNLRAIVRRSENRWCPYRVFHRGLG